MAVTRYYVNRTSGVLVRIRKVDDSYAWLDVLGENPTHYAMPRAQYDTDFVSIYRKAEPDDLKTAKDAEAFDLPANAPEDWRT